MGRLASAVSAVSRPDQGKSVNSGIAARISIIVEQEAVSSISRIQGIGHRVAIPGPDAGRLIGKSEAIAIWRQVGSRKADGLAANDQVKSTRSISPDGGAAVVG